VGERGQAVLRGGNARVDSRERCRRVQWRCRRVAVARETGRAQLQFSCKGEAVVLVGVPAVVVPFLLS
jgi:hypothetical protein